MNQATSIFGALYRRKHVVLLVMAGSIGVGLFQSARLPKDYVAAAEILVPNTPVGISIASEGGNVPTGPMLPEQNEGDLIGIVANLRSRAVMNRVAENVPGINPRQLKKNLRGDVTKDGVVEYKGYGRTPEEAARLANEAVKAFAEVLEEMALQTMQANLDTFTANEGPAWELVEEKSTELTEYLLGLGTADFTGEVEGWLDERARIETSRFQLEVRYQEALVQRPVIERALEGRPEYVESQRQMALPGTYNEALEHVTRLSSELAVARMKFTDEHPETIRLIGEVEAARARAEAQGDLVLSSVTTTQDRKYAELASKLVDMDILEAAYVPQRDAFDARKAELDAKLADVPGYMQKIETLQAEYRQRRDLAERITARKNEMELHIEHGLSFSMIDPSARAQASRAIALPTTTGLIMFTGLGGFLLGIFVALGSATIARMRATRPY
ncbi:MAG: hypothetical protein GY747_01985 [Planctomycetes bacterium]|nr:hypothetical protein [Planctomycetota bacterium]MCP4769998.1 hypothetical protein [Planctomycetota bacterium]MCP4859838.1 hypothetical protein [Planctomycetota bacterium]